MSAQHINFYVLHRQPIQSYVFVYVFYKKPSMAYKHAIHLYRVYCCIFQTLCVTFNSFWIHPLEWLYCPVEKITKDKNTWYCKVITSSYLFYPWYSQFHWEYVIWTIHSTVTHTTRQTHVLKLRILNIQHYNEWKTNLLYLFYIYILLS